MQFEELILGVKEGRLLLTRDYATSNTEAEVEADLAALAALPAASLIEPEPVALAMELAAPATDPDNPISPRGYALLARVPGMTNALANAIVAKFGSLQAILGAPLQDLIGVHGLTPVRARIIREGLSRVAETATLERFV
jgi:diadenylate cyclase